MMRTWKFRNSTRNNEVSLFQINLKMVICWAQNLRLGGYTFWDYGFPQSISSHMSALGPKSTQKVALKHIFGYFILPILGYFDTY